MKSWKKITVALTTTLLIVGIFVTSCVCAYKYNLNQYAFWWSWIAVIWVVDVFVGGTLFYKPNRTDETKAFWLLVMIALPIIGAAWAIIYNYKLKTNYNKPDNNHSQLQAAIFKARKSIKIYTNSFCVTNDTYKALNYARWKGVNVQIILQIQKSNMFHEYLIRQMQKNLEDHIQLFLTEKEITESFIVFDESEVLSTKTNFNFKQIYGYDNLVLDTHPNRYLSLWDNTIHTTSGQSLKVEKMNVFKKAWFKLVNIFYPFY